MVRTEHCTLLARPVWDFLMDNEDRIDSVLILHGAVQNCCTSRTNKAMSLIFPLHYVVSRYALLQCKHKGQMCSLQVYTMYICIYIHIWCCIVFVAAYTGIPIYDLICIYPVYVFYLSSFFQMPSCPLAALRAAAPDLQVPSSRCYVSGEKGTPEILHKCLSIYNLWESMRVYMVYR